MLVAYVWTFYIIHLGDTVQILGVGKFSRQFCGVIKIEGHLDTSFSLHMYHLAILLTAVCASVGLR